MRDIQAALDRWVKEGKAVALATVVGTWGSSPRQPGARMAIDSEGRIEGSVSGGCVEGAVITEALECLQNKQSRRLEFGVTDEMAWQVGLSCGGRLEVLVQPLETDWWQLLAGELEAERPVASLAFLESADGGERVLVGAAGAILWAHPELDDSGRQTLAGAASEALRNGRPAQEEVAGRQVFVDCLLPRPRLILIGGAHVAVALQSLARQLGFRVILVDPRRAFATPERFPGAEAIHHQYPQHVLPALALDSNTYVAVLTHDPKIDDPALLEALPSPAPYVGVLSSRRTHQKRVARLREEGLEESLIERVRTPIGLEIGARTPEEIALAVMAEIVQVRNSVQA